MNALVVPAASDAADVVAGVARAALRSVVVAVVATALAERLAALFRLLPAGKLRSACVGLCALPFLMPALVQGYAYSQLSLSLVRWPALLEIWYAALLVVRLVPVAVLVLYLAPPPPLSASALFCRDLLPRAAPLRSSGIAQRLHLALLGQWRNYLVAGAAVFVVAFPEFEVAALSSVRSWTVALFTAHTGGLDWRASLGLAVLPALVQLAALCVGLLAVRSWRGTMQRALRARDRASAGSWTWLVLAAVLGALVPATLVAAEGGSARELPWAQLATEIGWSVWFAAPAAAVAWWLAGRTVQKPALHWPLCLPGLCGALVLALLLFGLLQLPGASLLYDTPVPLMLALALLLLPPALSLRGSLGRSEASPAVHLATLLADSGVLTQQRAASRLSWHLRGRPRALLWGVLLFLGLFEVVATALLHPVTMTPAAVRLYNLMHYGHGAVLSGMVLALVLAGLALLVAAASVPGFVWSWSVSRSGGRRG